ncbi:MAG: lytic transglycosylase domain-containing protein, partial [Polyangia bacterium]
MLRLVLALTLAVSATAHAAPAKKPAKKSLVKRVVAHLKAPPSGKSPAPTAAVDRLGRGYKLYLDGQYEATKKELRGIEPKQMQNPDYVLYLLAQSELLSGEPKAAREHFHELTLLPSRFSTVAKWRVADCDWQAGDLETARKGYEAVLPSANDAVEPAVARFRIAEALAHGTKTGALMAAQQQWRKVYVGEPLHPLAEEALAKLTETKAPPITAEERIARAKILTNNRAWPRALDELALVPADAPQAVRDEADYWIGTTKFKMRRDYDVAAQKLLAIWSRLPGDELKADALFHGARAWSRADKDDEAQKGYREFLQRYPHSKKLAPEASFLIGWLDFNRGKYKEAIPELEETLKRYGGSAFGDDARWYLGLSRWLAGDIKGALADFEQLAKRSGALSGGKGAYWRARALDSLKREDEAKAVWRALVNEYPFSYYALQARARLKEKGVELGPFGDGPKGSAQTFEAIDVKLANDPLIMRVDELLLAGLTVEAGVELDRGDGDFIKRYGAPRALPLLFDRYFRGDNFHRPHQLAESYSGSALRLDPNSDATARKWWEIVYPRAYRQYIEKYAPTGENPPYYLYTIMQKESAYNPHDVSYADAIGLLQMIPPTSRRVALRIDAPYTDDVLYDPEGNIRFGAWYIGHLLQKFKGQIALGAGSYNAGPRAMMKWVKAHGARPLDEFIELTPYTQTREYMKKVLDIYSRYLWLYDKQDYLP